MKNKKNLQKSNKRFRGRDNGRERGIEEVCEEGEKQQDSERGRVLATGPRMRGIRRMSIIT